MKEIGCILSFHSPESFRGLKKRANVVLLVGGLFFFSPFEVVALLGNFSNFSRRLGDYGSFFNGVSWFP